ncbi:CobD/CbiB family protein [Methylibium sp. Root1272]|uniref:CobD/CbiB family protein n=1 Tax=Methylibium sp. Root1272 TaxID=1736441 RepID=UPI0006F902F8|nr:CobD/CbiB family protein [Methylibium sp. Root1272]KQW66829.1 cobalamin biosynthesis protein CbiB [Methylibium sp. Root1272]
MSFFAVLLALVIEQLHPLPRSNGIHDVMVVWIRWTGRNFDAGRDHHSWVVWIITVVLPALLVFAVHFALAHFSILLALVWDVLVLYLTLGFRQFSHYFTDIRDALERGDEIEARRLLAEWRQLDASDLPRTELLRHVIEHSLVAAHRHVFGVFFWFVLLSTLGLGPAGAVLYRLAEFSSRYWAFRSRTVGVPINERLMQRSQQLFAWIDHLPARLTAFGFAVVGDFEAAIECWRRDAGLWRSRNDGTILAAAAGAVGVRLGGSAPPPLQTDRSKDFATGANRQDTDAVGSTPGLAPELGHLRSVVGLVWRSVVLWMLLLALLSLANLIG